jgi:hypothetical protein
MLTDNSYAFYNDSLHTSLLQRCDLNQTRSGRIAFAHDRTQLTEVQSNAVLTQQPSVLQLLTTTTLPRIYC